MIENQTLFDTCAAVPVARPVVLGAGPVGRAVAQGFASRGATPSVLTRGGSAVAGADAVAVDVTDVDALADVLAAAGADVVVQAAQPPYHRWEAEFPAMQESVLTACERTGTALVAVENLYGYGSPGRAMTESTPLRPDTRKGRVRAAMSRELADFHRAGRVRTAAVRASDFVGPGVAASAFGERFLGRLARGKRAELLGDPDALHSVTFVPDLAEAVIRLAGHPAAFGRAWHVPSAPATSQRHLVELAAAEAGTEPAFRAVGARTMRFFGLFNRDAQEVAEMVGEFEHDFVLDSSAFEEAFAMPPTPLSVGLAAAIESYRSPR